MSRYPLKYTGEIWRWNHPLVGAGPNAATFQISPERSIKFRTTGWGPFREISKDDAAIHYLYSEHDSVQKLREMDISVPESIGVFTVPLKTLRTPYTLSRFGPRYFPGIVMRHIDGIFIGDAPQERRRELEAMAFAEISKAIAAGLRVVGEYNPNKNVIWVPDTKGKGAGTIYLTGFSQLFSGSFEKKF